MAPAWWLQIPYWNLISSITVRTFNYCVGCHVTWGSVLYTGCMGLACMPSPHLWQVDTEYSLIDYITYWIIVYTCKNSYWQFAEIEDI